MNAEPWVTATEVAQYLGGVKDAVYHWRERKDVLAPKIGRLWKFQLSEVKEWACSGEAEWTGRQSPSRRTRTIE